MDYSKVGKVHNLREWTVKRLTDLSQDQMKALNELAVELAKAKVAVLKRSNNINEIRFNQGGLDMLDKFLNEINLMKKEVKKENE